MKSYTVWPTCVLLLRCSQALAQTQQVQYNQVLNINGDMKLNSFQFPDRSKVETFSQKQQQILVNQQTPAIPANQVTGSSGQSFVALTTLSMSINTNGATDLVGGAVELTMDQQALNTLAVQSGNTYVAMLSPDRQTWMIQETMRSINGTDMTVRMVKRQTLDGEYMALGRQTKELNTVLTPFGSDPSTQVAIQGTGLQENEFQDGFRMSIKASQPLLMNVDVKQGVSSSMLSALSGEQSVNNFRYSVTTNLAGVSPGLNRQVSVVQIPLNAQRIQSMMQAAGIQPGGQVQLSVAQRGILQNPGGATGQLQGLGSGTPATGNGQTAGSTNTGGGAAAGGDVATLALSQKRGRLSFRSSIMKRELQGGTASTESATGQAAPGTGQTQTGDIQGAGQAQTGQTQTGQTQTGQTQGTGQAQGTGQTEGSPGLQGAANGQTNNGTASTQQGTAGNTNTQPPPQTQPQTQPQQQGTPSNNNPAAAQLLLSPTFTPISGPLILDPVNMRVAFPVNAVDGEYIITMQTGSTQAQAQGQNPPQQQQQPQGASPASTPVPGTAGQQSPEQPPTPEQSPSRSSSSTSSTKEPRPKPSSQSSANAGNSNSTIPAERRWMPHSRASNDTEAQQPRKGSVYITMREVDMMVQLGKWGGQAPISKMMSDFMAGI